MGKGKWLSIIIVVAVVGLGYLAYSLFIHSGVDYLTVSELKSQADSLNSTQVRVGGRIAPGSIDWDDKARVIRFTLTDDRESLSVVHNGMVPDNFKPGAELIVEGKYRPDNIFEALSFSNSRSVCNLCH